MTPPRPPRPLSTSISLSILAANVALMSWTCISQRRRSSAAPRRAAGRGSSLDVAPATERIGKGADASVSWASSGTG